MLIMRQRPAEAGAAWECPRGMNPILHRMLLTRGVTSDDGARAFLHPGMGMLHDPFLLHDMRRAVDVINAALKAHKRICVYGDYDVDGVCASAILTLYLRERGAQCEPYLPSRHKEGYGLNADAVDRLAREYDLLITVDCGITAFELVERALSEGMQVIVTDHHQIGDRLPPCPTVNPLLGEYPFRYLCGAGVAFQLVAALAGRSKAMEYVDLAALATIADIVPLRDENRAIAYLGLKRINYEYKRPGIRALMEVSGLDGRIINAGNVAFQMTPRMNASGRIGDAMRAYSLMVSRDREECMQLAAELDEENLKRKELENKAINEAEAQLAAYDFYDRSVIIVKGEGWNLGVIGLAASRLTEKYHYPTVVFTNDEDGSLVGSCRSIEGVDIFEALTHTADLLERFGGHKMAAGLKLAPENLSEFSRRLGEYIKTTYDFRLWIPCLEYDWAIGGRELTPELTQDAERLAPTGCQNPGAVFLSRGEVTEAYPVGREMEHLKLALKTEDGTFLPGIWFRHAADAPAPGSAAEILYAPSVNEYQGRRSIQAEVKTLAHSEAGEGGEASGFIIDACARFGPCAPEADASRVAQAFSSLHKGSIIIAADAKSANAALPYAGDMRDILIDAYPTDARLFNAVCVAPEGCIMPGYRHIYYAGVPACLCAGGEKIRQIPLAECFKTVPGRDELGEIYRKIKALSGGVFASCGAAARMLAREAGISVPSAALGYGVLAHMGLAGLERTKDGLKLFCKWERKSLEDDALYISLRACAEN